MTSYMGGSVKRQLIWKYASLRQTIHVRDSCKWTIGHVNTESVLRTAEFAQWRFYRFSHHPSSGNRRSLKITKKTWNHPFWGNHVSPKIEMQLVQWNNQKVDCKLTKLLTGSRFSLFPMRHSQVITYTYTLHIHIHIHIHIHYISYLTSFKDF